MEQTSTRTTNQAMLRAFIEAEADRLLGILRYYLVRANLADQQGATLGATELLNEVVVEALEHAERFRPSGQPMAWLLGIAANLIKRKQAKHATRNRREPLVRDLYPATMDAMSESELFDKIASLTTTTPLDEWEANEAASELLSGLSENDQRVLRLAILHDLDGQALAQELGVSPGTARVRLHRALKRLRYTWHKDREDER